MCKMLKRHQSLGPNESLSPKMNPNPFRVLCHMTKKTAGVIKDLEDGEMILDYPGRPL